MEINSNKEVSLKEIRENYYRLLSFEISNLWQRSIFLSAMIVLLFTCYGYLLSDIIKGKYDNLLLNEICCIVSIIGIVFSIIWIMMSKGSKAWFEVYEKKIIDIEKNEELNISGEFHMGGNCIPWKLSNNLFRKSAGAYSVSKLNILIGQVLAIIWFTTTIIHYIGIFNIINNNIINLNRTLIGGILLIIFLIIIIFIILTAYMNCWAKSSTIENPK